MDEEEIPVVPITDKYAALFSTGMGREVLADILTACHFGCSLDPQEGGFEAGLWIGEYNVGVLIAKKSGFLKAVDSLLGLVDGQ